MQVSTELTEKYGCYMKKENFLFVIGSLILMTCISFAIFAMQTCLYRIHLNLAHTSFFLFC